MVWVLVWTVLAVGAVVVLSFLGWRLWRAGKALSHEIGAAGANWASLGRALDDPQPGRSSTVRTVNPPRSA